MVQNSRLASLFYFSLLNFSFNFLLSSFHFLLFSFYFLLFTYTFLQAVNHWETDGGEVVESY